MTIVPLKDPFLFQFLLLLFTLTSSSSSPPFTVPITNQYNHQFPCKPPHNSYPFCNTSLPISTRSQSIISLLTLSEKIRCLCNNFTGISKLHIPPYEWWSESLHGIATNGPGVTFSGPIRSATMFPQVLLTAASFNRSLWYKMASAIAVEGRAMYNHGQAGLTFWAPNINIFRDPRWGRGQETPGEDPLLVSQFAVDFVKGFQVEGLGVESGVRGGGGRRVLLDDGGGGGGRGGGGDGDSGDGRLMLSACCKHFIAYDLEKWQSFSRYNFNAVVTEYDMEDTYQPPFKSCIREGKASCLMCSYNRVNGIPACAAGDLLQRARTEWGFQGYIASDCDAVATIFEYQHYAKSKQDAVADALKAGVDINCGTYMLHNTKRAVKHGKIKEQDIDRALQNLFNVQLRLGIFDGDPSTGKFGTLGALDVCSKEHRKLALEAARQGVVLLKNDKKLLPLNKDSVSSVAIIGPTANDTSQLGGAYSGIPCEPKSYVEGIQMYIKNTRYAAGCPDIPCGSSSQLDEAILIAKEADHVIVVAGLDLTQETEDKDRVSLLLPGKQMELVSSVAAVSKRPLVLVLTGGGPLDVSFAKQDPKIASILWVGYPGEAGGEALGEIVFGDYNPGRLPVTWYPESFTKVPMNDMNMRADPSRGYPGRTYRFYTGESVYEFGHGLSYSSYRYKFLSAPTELDLSRLNHSGPTFYTRDGMMIGYILTDEHEHSICDSLRFYVEVSVKNVGTADGSHVVLLFHKTRSLIRAKGAPQKQLVGFGRVQTAPHETVETSILVDPCKHLSFANERGQRLLPLGNHILMLEDLEHPLLIGT
ncbi:Probable beta-D-xylosidase 6 [Dionaea muscipula]